MFTKKMGRKIVAILLCILQITAFLQYFSLSKEEVKAAGVVTSIDVKSTVTSSKSITEQTKNDTYQVRDAICSFSDGSINRATSEHFQIIWGNEDTTGTVTYDFIVGNLINLENIRAFYVEELGMKDIGISQNKGISGLYKTNVYVSNTGLDEFTDDWAYMSVDRDAFAYLFVAPGAMRVDEPSWVIPHELAHVFTYHQGGTIAYAWYEATANWFRDQYLGSEYYAYGGRTYGPTSDFFAPYMINSAYHVPHMLNWYDTWPIFLYISENPDNIPGLGMELMHKIVQHNGENESMYDTIESLSGVSIKTILGGMSRRLATMDFSRQEHYLNRLNNEVLPYDNNYSKIYTTLENADSNGWQNVPSNRAPMQTGFNIIPLNVDLTKDYINVDFKSTSSANGADFRTSIVTSTRNNLTRYSNMVSGDGKATIRLNGDETKAYLVVCATPDTIEEFQVGWDSSADEESTRFTYKVKITATDEVVEDSDKPATIKRISVHDPSIFKDLSTNKYYLYGSHLAQAVTSNLMELNAHLTQGYGNNNLYVSENVEGIYYIQNQYSGLYLDVADASLENGANIQQWAYKGTKEQKFKLVSLGNGYYYILTGASDYTKCVDVENGSADNGTNIIQWEYWGGYMQTYRIVKQPDKSYAILTGASDCTGALDVYDWSTQNGGNVNQWSFLGGGCQKWNLIEAEANSGSTQASTSEPLKNALEPSFLWAGYNDSDCSGGYAVWAPDIIYNPDYVWNDGSKGAYMMYYSTSSTYIRSCIGYAVSKSAAGPFSYVDTIVYSGFTKADNNVTTTSDLGTKTVNTCYTNTNIPYLIANGQLSGVRNDWFNSNGSFNNSLCPNAIDPTILYDESGNMWMTYGSWSGGIYILQLDKATGQPIYPKTNSGLTDGYFGKRIAGGYTLSGEAPYIVYDEETDYYYLYVTYGWLGVDGGYHIRLYRSKTIDGTYTDAAGNSATYSSMSINQGNYGIKLFGNYDFSTLKTDGYKSGGHNSAFIDTDGQRYLVYHTRFNSGTEYHEVRIHQQFMNEDNWPVTAVYEYLGSSISKNGYTLADMAGTYEFVIHGKDAATENVGMLSTKTVTLNNDGTISGAYSGTWAYTNGTYYCQMKINGVTYKGVFFKQKDESAQQKEVMTFTLIGNDNQAVWGTKTVASTEENPGDSGSGSGSVSASAVTHNFTANGKTSDFFSITGNTSTSYGSVTYAGLKLTTCLKMESSTNISFTAPAKGKLTLIFSNTSGTTIKVNGTTMSTNTELVVDVAAGNVTVTKGSGSSYLFYMVYEPEQQAHTHSYSSSVTKQPTCTETGVRTYSCSCGSSYTESIAAKGHDYESNFTVDKEATATTEGSKSRHCKNCSAKTDVTVIPALGYPQLKVQLNTNTSSAKVGDTISFTANATGGSGNYTYSFLMYNEAAGTWYRFSSFAAANTYNWTIASAGNRTFFVEVKDSTGTVVRSAGIKVAIANNLSVNITANATNVSNGQNVSFSASATGGNGNYTYSFLMHNESTNSWYRFSDFAKINTLNWTANGNRTFYVEVKDSTGAVARSNGIKINVSANTLKVTISSNAQSVLKGSNVAFSASASGGSGSYTYSFLVYNEVSGYWYRFSDFAAVNKLSWIAGTTDRRTFYVEVKDSTGAKVRSEGITMTILESSNLTVNVTASNNNPYAGENVKLTATASGGAGSYTYSFLMYNPTSGNWHRFSDFTQTNVMYWTANGNREFYVDVKDGNGTVVRSAVKKVTIK